MADHSYFANLIWQIADLLRGPYRPPQYERVMLPMTVLRRVDCVLAPSKAKVLAEYERRKGGRVEGAALDLRLNRAAGQRFHNRSPLDFRKFEGDPDNIERHLVAYVNGFSRNVREIFEFFEFENEIERMREARQGQDRLRDQLQPPLLQVHTAAAAGGHRRGAEENGGEDRVPAEGGVGVSLLAWADRLPDNWEAEPLRSAATCVVSNVDKLSDDDETPVRLCNYTDVYHNEFITPALDFMHTTAPEDEIKKFGLAVDDVIITKDSESWDDIGVPALVRETAGDLVCGYHLALLPPLKRKMDGAFLLRCLQAKPIRLQLELAANGITRFGIPKSEIGTVRLPVPPLPQQGAIADYLDREMARLDALIAAKEHVLGLLADKRRALITRAVTRGIDPDAPLRDSGIPWLDEIPAHWETVALRFLVDMTSGATPDTGEPEYWYGEIPWVSPKDMKENEITDTQDHVSEVALSESPLRLIEPGAVLIVVRGMVPDHSFPTALNMKPVTINQDMKALRCCSALVPQFLRNFFRGYEEHIVSLADSSAHGTRKLDTEVLGRLEIPLPPQSEQQQILTYLDEVASKLDSLQLAARNSMALVKERRTALIAAAVTGRVDVGATS